MKIFVPDRFGKWLYRRPSARGARDGPPGGPGRSPRRAMVEIPPQASVRNGPEAGKALGLRAAGWSGSCGDEPPNFDPARPAARGVERAKKEVQTASRRLPKPPRRDEPKKKFFMSSKKQSRRGGGGSDNSVGPSDEAHGLVAGEGGAAPAVAALPGRRRPPLTGPAPGRRRARSGAVPSLPGRPSSPGPSPALPRGRRTGGPARADRGPRGRAATASSSLVPPPGRDRVGHIVMFDVLPAGQGSPGEDGGGRGRQGRARDGRRGPAPDSVRGGRRRRPPHPGPGSEGRGRALPGPGRGTACEERAAERAVPRPPG
ncbi:hypothetical protein THAOC_25421, partial [Thalassiosira oceanica]